MLSGLKNFVFGTTCLAALGLAPIVAMAATVDTASEVLGSYNLFVSGNVGSSGSAYTTDSQGTMVVGGNAYLQNMDVSTQGQTNGYGLVVGGSLDLTSGTVHGSTYVGQSADITSFSALGSVTTGSNLTLTSGSASGNLTVGGATKATSVSIGGSVSSQGNYTMTSGSVGGNVTVGTQSTASTLSLTSSAVRGSATASGTATVSQSSVGGTTAAGSTAVPTASAAASSVSSPLDISASYTNLKTESTSLSTLSQTAGATTTVAGSSMTLTAASGKTVDIFDISASSLSKTTAFTLNAAAGDTVIINVSGTNASLQNASYNLTGGITGSHVLFNFYNATDLLITSIAEDGSILAPNATITGSNARVAGSIIADALEGSVQLNSDAFTGSLSPVPLPGALILFMSAIGGLGLAAHLRRRRPQP
jgi:choice-of-anchor A domain-containing protein